MLGVSIAAMSLVSYALGDLALDDDAFVMDAGDAGPSDAEAPLPIVPLHEFLIASGAEPSHPDSPLVLTPDQQIG
ncbi:MAG: hypothetical protein ACU0CO_09710 [Shimia sp.]